MWRGGGSHDIDLDPGAAAKIDQSDGHDNALPDLEGCDARDLEWLRAVLLVVRV
jgi:hypothetical protein